MILQAAWAEHKKVHKQGEWLFVTQKGKGRVSKRPEFNWTGELRPFPVGPRQLVSSLAMLP